MTFAEAIAADVRNAGFDTCTEQHVLDVIKHGSVEQGTVSDEYDERLTDAIQEALDESGYDAVQHRERALDQAERNRGES